MFAFTKSKGHEGGKEHVGPYHVYTNMIETKSYPVLALIRYLLVFPDQIRLNPPLFEGSSQ